MQMAVFLVNSCKFNGCGLIFPTLGELIQHIEENHIDSDPRILEKQELQQPPSLALSYVLRFFTEASRKEHGESQKKKIRLQSSGSSIRSSTPTGSEYDEEEMATDDEDSDDSWTTQEEFTSEIILSMMNNKDGNDPEKPFACPVPGCKKRYKNVNGIKYHAKHGHRKDTRVKKAHKCQCGKSYKTNSGLRSHMVTSHPSADLLLTSQQQRGKLQLTTASVAQNTITSVTTIPHSQLSQTLAQQIVTPISVAGIVTNGVTGITKNAANKTPLQQLQHQQIQQQLQAHLQQQQQQLQQQLQQLGQPVQLTAATQVTAPSAEQIQQQIHQQLQLQEQLQSSQQPAAFIQQTALQPPSSQQTTSTAATATQQNTAASMTASQLAQQKQQEHKDLNLQLQQHIQNQIQRQQQQLQQQQQSKHKSSASAGNTVTSQTLQLTPITSLQAHSISTSSLTQVLSKTTNQTVVAMPTEQAVSQ